MISRKELGPDEFNAGSSEEVLFQNCLLSGTIAITHACFYYLSNVHHQNPHKYIRYMHLLFHKSMRVRGAIFIFICLQARLMAGKLHAVHASRTPRQPNGGGSSKEWLWFQNRDLLWTALSEVHLVGESSKSPLVTMPSQGSLFTGDAIGANIHPDRMIAVNFRRWPLKGLGLRVSEDHNPFPSVLI